MNKNKINIVEYCKEKILYNEIEATADENNIYCEIDNEIIILKKDDYILLDIIEKKANINLLFI